MVAFERLLGSTSLFSAQRRIQLTNAVMIYDYGYRAGFVIGTPDTADPRVEDVFVSHPVWIRGVRILIAVLHELGGYNFVDPQEEIRRQRERQLHCERCRGTGQIEDFEGNWIQCPECSL
jgi:hypothetical protein